MYHVFQVNLKKRKYRTDEFEEEEDLRDFLAQYILKNKKYSRNIGFEDCELYEITNEAMKIGMILLDEKKGSAIVKIIQGKQIEDPDSEEEILSSMGSDSEKNSEENSEDESGGSEECSNENLDIDSYKSLEEENISMEFSMKSLHI